MPRILSDLIGTRQSQFSLRPAASPGAPTSGTYARGTLWMDSSGELWRCVTAGTPGTWVQIDGAAGVANGGTGQSSYAVGDMLYATGTTTLAKLGIGAAGRVLQSNGTAPTWFDLFGTANSWSAMQSFNGGMGYAGTVFPGVSWTTRSNIANQGWRSVCYGNGLFVAVSNDGSTNVDRVMTSPDGVVWTVRNGAGDGTFNKWNAVCYGNGVFVAVGQGASSTRVMTSYDGINWTIRDSAAQINYTTVTYGGGLFVAMSPDNHPNQAMTSPDGIIWTQRTANNSRRFWSSICYGNGTFVAVEGDTAGQGSGYLVTSTDGVNWTLRAPSAFNQWMGVCFGNGRFVAVARNGTNDRVMTSTDGITWTTSPGAPNIEWMSVCYGGGLFLAVARTGTGNRVMTSPDGITWTARTSSADNEWYSVCYGNGVFVAVSTTGTSNRVMTSGFAINPVQGFGVQESIERITPQILPAGVIINRADTSLEGGQINYRRASDNAEYWFTDVHGSGSTPNFRIFANSGLAGTTPFIFTPAGNFTTAGSIGIAMGAVPAVTDYGTLFLPASDRPKIIWQYDTQTSGTYTGYGRWGYQMYPAESAAIVPGSDYNAGLGGLWSVTGLTASGATYRAFSVRGGAGTIGIGTDPSATVGEKFRLGDGTRTITMGVDANQPWFGTLTNHDLRLVTNNAERVRIDANGNLGIGVVPVASQGRIQSTTDTINAASLDVLAGAATFRNTNTAGTATGSTGTVAWFQFATVLSTEQLGVVSYRTGTGNGSSGFSIRLQRVTNAAAYDHYIAFDNSSGSRVLRMGYGLNSDTIGFTMASNGAVTIPNLTANVLTVAGVTQSIHYIQGSSGYRRGVELRNTSGPSVRWYYGDDGTAESGSNVGASFIIAAYDDTGTLVNNAVTITRATGKVTVGAGGMDCLGVSRASNYFGVTTFTTPASATAAGTAGYITWDTNYIYVCTGTNAWKRVALATW